MSEEQESGLVKLGEGGAVQKYDEKAFESVVSSGAFLPYMQLMTSSSKVVKKQEFPENHYALVQSGNRIDLGKEVDVLPLVWRPRAVEIGDDDGVLSAYDPEEAEFKRIQEIAARPGLNGCMCGPEYLIWLPKQQRWTTFLMGSKSAKREAPNMSKRLNMATTLKSHFIETKSYSWWAALVVPCTAQFELPDEADMAEVIAKFNDPPKQEKERAEEPAAGEQAR